MQKNAYSGQFKKLFFLLLISIVPNVFAAELLLSPAEKAWLKAHPQIRLGIDPAWPPLEFIDSKGLYQGISSEYAGYLEQVLNVAMQPVPGLDWEQVIERVKIKEIDVLPAVLETPNRHAYLNFTKPYIRFPVVVFVRKDTPFITGLEELEGKNVAVEKAYATQEYLQRNHPYIRSLEVLDAKEGLTLVALGKADAYVGNLLVGTYIIERDGLANIKVGAPTPYTFEISIGVRKDWPELVPILEKALDSIDLAKKSAMRQKWLSLRYDVRINYALAWKIIGIASVIIFFVLLWLFQIRRQKEALRIAKEEAEQASYFKTYFLANMSHEIRTPMNAIIGFSHLLERTGLNPKQADYLRRIDYSTQALLGIINDVLDFSKIEAGELSLEQTDFLLDEVLESVTNMVMMKAGQKGLEVLLQRDLNIPNHLIGDPLRLEQVLANLVGNAVKFTEKGEIRLEISQLSSKRNQVSVAFAVKDTGIGIDTANLQILFDAFVQADGSTTRRYGGSGLGLAIVKQLISLMGGNLQVESESGKGSVFSFNLSFALGDSAVVPVYQAEPDLRGLHVLVVDDNLSARHILQDMLESLSFHVDTAPSGEAALQKSGQEAASSSYDLILMDWDMPGMKGVEAAQRIHSHDSLGKIPIIMMVTAFAKEELLEEIRENKLGGFLTKPVNPSSLFDSIISAFHAKQQTGSLSTLQEQSEKPLYRLRGKVLLTDDNLINQEMAQELLAGMGLDVTIAANGREALQALAVESFDLVLMDIQMPEMDGYEATRQIRMNPKWKNLPVIAMTAHAMQGDRELCLEAGMNEHIPKPIDYLTLHATLSHWLTNDGKPIVTQQAAEEESGGLPETAPGLDVLRGLQRMGGKQDLYRRLLKEFKQNHAGAGEKLRQALDAADITLARREAHTVRGVSGNIGARELESSARDLERMLSREQIDNIDILLNVFQDELTQVIDSICVLLEIPQENVLQQDDMQASVTPHEWKNLLEELNEMLTHGDIESSTRLELLAKCLGKDFPLALRQRMEEEISQFDFDEAKAGLEELKRLLQKR